MSKKYFSSYLYCLGSKYLGAYHLNQSLKQPHIGDGEMSDFGINEKKI
jgi:hypothetical protein